MDLFEEIRREYEFGVACISGVARKFGVHRRMVREAIDSAIPMRLPAKERPRPTIGPLAEFIDAGRVESLTTAGIRHRMRGVA